MERYRVRASYNNANLPPTPNHFFRSSRPAAVHTPLPPNPTPHPVFPELTRSGALSRRRVDTEISIFDAERYFNGDREDNTLVKNNKTVNILNGAESLSFVDASSSNVPRESSVSSGAPSVVDGGGYGRSNYFPTRSFRGATTPTASSEASWNSQTGLLVANAPGSVAVSVRAYPASASNETRKGWSNRGRRFFGLPCPCYSKKSVQVEDKFSETGRSSIRSSTASRRSTSTSTHVPNKETMSTKFKIRATEPGLCSLDPGAGGGFSFPVPPLTKELELEPARESLEVFRPSEELSRTLRKPSQLHLRMAPVRDEDDMASDTSSDLFELESFSAHSASLYRRRDSLDELPKFASAAGLQFRRSSEESVAPSECYAPSEASVAWSVTTAEPGFDRASVANFSSAASDCGEAKGLFHSAGKEGGGIKKRGGGGGGGLLNCRSEKAVSVGPKPVRVGPD